MLGSRTKNYSMNDELARIGMIGEDLTSGNGEKILVSLVVWDCLTILVMAFD